MSKRFAMCLAAAMIGAACISGCSNNNKKAEAPAVGTVKMANTKCPYSHEPVNPSVSTAYKGQNVGFCCAGCKGKWDKASDADRDAMLAKAK
jgi:hypothetical protein